MAARFMSSKVSAVWKDKSEERRPTTKRRKREAGEEDKLGISDAQLRQLMEEGGGGSERTRLAEEMGRVKKKKGTNQAVSYNYATLQAKQRRLKVLEAEQRERDKELGGGVSIVKRSGGKKARKKPTASLKEGLALRGGGVFVSDKVLSWWWWWWWETRTDV